MIPSKTVPFKVFSTFTGIGGFEVGIENAIRAIARHTRHEEKSKRPGLESAKDQLHGGHIGDARLVGYSEIDKYAVSVFERHFKGVKNYGDITKINAAELPDFDCLVGGFPCQSFSIAGRRAGFEDTRGTLFFDLARILRAKRPRLFVFENVKGLLSHDGGRTFATIISAIAELGYDAQWQVVNSKNHGVPQNRERIIIVGHLRGTARPSVFPLTESDSDSTESDPQVRDLAQTITATYFKGWKGSHVLAATIFQRPRGKNKGAVLPLAPTLTGRSYQDNNHLIVTGIADRGREGGTQWEARKDGLANTLRTAGGRGSKPHIMLKQLNPGASQDHRIYDIGGISPTLSPAAGAGGAVVPKVFDGDMTESVIRRLTPTECERLQGFPDRWTLEGVSPDGSIVKNSDTQRYKMCGNAVTTNVIQAVFERILA